MTPVVLIALLASACIGASEASPPPDPPTASTTAPPTTIDPDLPVDGGVLQVAVSELRSLDPVASNIGSASDLLVADLIFDGLTDIAAGGDEVSPAIATEWRSNGKATVWTFELGRRTFADGTPITAADVVFTLNRARSSFGLVAQPLAVIESVRVVEGPAVRIRLTRPSVRLPELLAAPSLGIVSKAQVEGDERRFLSHPVGSGPFGEVAGTEQGILLSSTSDAVHLEAVEIVETGSADSAWQLQEEGGADVALLPDDESATASAVSTPFRALLFFGMNVNHPSLQDPVMRRAIVAAVDADSVTAAGLGDRAEAASGVGPGADGCGAGCEIDTEAAAELVADLGQDLPMLHIDHRDDPTDKSLAEEVVRQLRAAGFDAETRSHGTAEYGDFLVSGDHEIFRFGHVGVAPVADAYLPLMFGSESANNVTGFGSPEMDSTMEDAAGSGDGDAWHRVEVEIMDEAPLIPVARYVTRWAVAERVRDLVIDHDGTFEPTTVWVADE